MRIAEPFRATLIGWLVIFGLLFVLYASELASGDILGKRGGYYNYAFDEERQLHRNLDQPCPFIGVTTTQPCTSESEKAQQQVLPEKLRHYEQMHRWFWQDVWDAVLELSALTGSVALIICAAFAFRDRHYWLAWARRVR